MGKEGRTGDKERLETEKHCMDLALIVEDERYLARRVFHYLKRHPEKLKKYGNAYAVTELIGIICTDKRDITIEEAKNVENFIADLFNSHPMGKEFKPTRKQLKHYDQFPVSTETLLQYANSLFKQPVGSTQENNT